MRALMKSLKSIFRSTHEYRSRFLGYLMLGLTPFLLIALFMNLHFLQSRLADLAEITHGVSTQACSQLSSLYSMSTNLAQNVHIHTNLQNEVLPTYGQNNDYQVLNRNFFKLQSLMSAYTLLDDILDIRFYMPSGMVVPNGTSILNMDEVEQEPWYGEYMQIRNSRRWYLADGVQDSGARDVLCIIRPIQHPMNFSCIVGYLRIDVALESIRRIIDESCIMEGTSCFIVDHDQGIIWHTGTLDEDSFLSMEDVVTFPASPQYRYITHDMQTYLISEHTIPSSTMSIVYLVPQMSIAKDILMNCMLQFILLMLEILLLVIITAVFSGSLISSKNNQLRLLNEQINPHFLYNTLDLINWQAINQDLPDIYRPIQALSRFYKITLNHGSDFIRIADEVEHICLYLDLQNIRFKNGISYQIEVDPQIRECFILHMVLQPIVENAVVHGIREKDSQRGTIHISASEEHGQLLFVISDDGVGMEKSVADQLLRGDSSVGYGLSNILQRIHLYYGRRYGMTIQSSAGEGTTVRISMPCIRQEPPTRAL
ncbi:MAG: sensor histidine kinase [Candidatus Faecivicinus sp.]